MIGDGILIPTDVRRFFAVTDYQPYYGNVLNPLICALKASKLREAEVISVLDEAMDLEDFLSTRGLLEPLYAAYVARPSVQVSPLRK